MAYATLSDLRSRLGSQVSASDPGIFQQLTDKNAATTESTSVATVALDAASGIIDMKLGVKYAVPIVTTNTTVLAVLNGYTLDITEWKVWKEHPQRKTIPARVQTAYDEAIQMLDDLVLGNATLPSDVPLAGNTADGAEFTGGGFARAMTETALKTGFLT